MSALHEKLVRWFCTGRVGMSSQHMAAVAAGEVGNGRHPLDPDDLSRCIALLEAVPEVRERFPVIAASTPKWAELIKHWDDIVGIFHAEKAASGGREYFDAKMTYHAMKEIGL